MKKLFWILFMFLPLAVISQQKFLIKVAGTDTASISARINLKVNISDTAAMLSPYLRSNIAAATYQPVGSYATTTQLNLKVDSVTSAHGQLTDTIRYWRNGTAVLVDYLDRADGFVSGGVVTWSGTGLIYNITPAVYYIDGVRYTSVAQSITLTAADVTNDRIDVLALDNTGTFVKVTGTAAASPIEPIIDPATQIYRTNVTVAAGATVPSNTSQLVQYDESTGSPEWPGTASGGATVSFTGVTNPFNLTKTTDIGSFTTGQTVTYTKSSGSVSSSAYNIEKFYIRLKAAFANNTNILVTYLNGATVISNSVTLTATHGFSKSIVGTYQNISIPMSAFTFTNNSITAIRFTFQGSNASGLYIDYLQLLQGTTTGGTSGLTQVTATTDATGTTNSSGVLPLTLATVNSNVGTWNNITINAKGLATAGSNISYATTTQLGAKLDTSGSYVNSGTIIWPGTIYSTPTTGVKTDHAISYSPSLASQSAYTLFGRGSGSGVPSFLASIDSNWIPTLHTENYFNTKYAAIGAISSQWVTSGSNIYYTAGNVLIGTPTDDGHTLRVNGSVSFNLGSDATGDMFIRTVTGDFARLPIGTASQHLVVVGGLPAWRDTAVAGGSVTPAALTKTDDTNVTLTLGGTPTTALLQATSMSLGWTGNLAATRGGTGTATVTTGDLLYGSASNVWSKLGIGTSKQHLVVVSGLPAWRDTAVAGGGSGWALTGNAGTTAGTNFIGTTDAIDLQFKTNNTNWLTLNTTGALIFPSTTVPALPIVREYYYDAGAGTRSGLAKSSGAMQWFVPAANTYSWNGGGDMNASIATNQWMALTSSALTVLGSIVAGTGSSITGTLSGLTTVSHDNTTTGVKDYFYNNGAGSRIGIGQLPGYIQHFFLNSSTISWNGGGDLQSAGSNEWMRLDSTGLSVRSTSRPASSGFEVGGTNKGSRPFPTLTSTQRDAIASPATGLQVYNSTTASQENYDGVSWKQGATWGYIAKTATYTALSTDYTIDCTANTFTVTLPTAVGIQGRVYIIKNSGAGTITMAGTSAQTFDGVTSPTIAAGAVSQYQSNNANWIKIN